MNEKIGVCSLCGGNVYGHVGPWWGVVPPPPARCTRCGAYPVGHAERVIPMEHPRGSRPMVYDVRDQTWYNTSGDYA